MRCFCPQPNNHSLALGWVLGLLQCPAKSLHDMPQYVLERKQTIAGDLSTVFSFFENPHNLGAITPPWLNFRVQAASDDSVKQGTVIRYVIRWFGLPMRWKSLIARHESKVMFADEMLEGPYRSWYHTHSFREVDGGVSMMDRVEYEMPLGWLGRIAHRMIVRRQLNAIFDYRASEIARILS